MAFSFVYGQKNYIPLELPTKVVKVDTIVISQGKNFPGCKDKPSAPKPFEYKTVPLAGQKSYFGDMNDYVMQFVRKYLQTHDKSLFCVKGRGITSFTVIDTVLKKNKIPVQLKYLAVIESALNHNAVSRVGAVGPWQLMKPTARLMGLTVTRKHDERRDLYKSTNAAAKYLSILYNQLNDWLLVIAAYNCGPAPVKRAIDRTGSTNFWDIKQYLPRETQGHVLAFIATATIFENLSKFIGLGQIPVDVKFDDQGRVIAEVTKDKTPSKPKFTEQELKNMAIVFLKEPLSLELMSQELSIDLKLLNRWNNDYELFEYNTYPSDTYKLRIPKDKLEVFLQKKEFLAKRSKQIYEENSM
jgi:membrane-bound lytic murein transglycosylase D